MAANTNTPVAVSGGNSMLSTPPKLMPRSKLGFKPKLLPKPQARRIGSVGFPGPLAPPGKVQRQDSPTNIACSTPLYSYSKPHAYLLHNAPKFPDVLSPGQEQQRDAALTMEAQAQAQAQAQETPKYAFAAATTVKLMPPKRPLMSLEDLEQDLGQDSQIALPEIPDQDELLSVTDTKPIRARLKKRPMPAC